MTQKYVLFDIGNVLVNFDFQLLMDRIGADSGRPSTPYSERDWEMYDAVERGKISDEAFVDYLNEANELDWSVESYIDVWRVMFSVNPVGRGLYLDAIKRGLPVYTLSNIAAHHMVAIERNEPGFFAEATGLFLSYQMGARKPETEIYSQVLQSLGANGEQCFFLDDRLENVEAARSAGINAYHFIPENHAAVHDAARLFFG